MQSVSDDMQNPATIHPLDERIRQVINDDIRPFIEMDGGGIDFVRFEMGVVYVRLFGACQSCPSSTLTLKGGVEEALCRRIPEVESVQMDGLEPLAGPLGGHIPTFQL